MKKSIEKRRMYISHILAELKNKGLTKERKELIRELEREGVYDSSYYQYKRSRVEEDWEIDIKEFYDTQAWILDRFFPLYTDEGDINIEILPYEYDEFTDICVLWEDESDLNDYIWVELGGKSDLND